jgi:predicted transcriptional regulator
MSLTETNVPKTGEQRPLRRKEIHTILHRHKGSIAAVARDLGVTITSVSMCLRGRGTSARIEEALRKKALELLEQERQAA